MRIQLRQALQFLYDEEQNVEISSFWDGGWTFRLGDRMGNGFKAEENFDDLDTGAAWLVEEFIKLHPNRSEAAHDYFDSASTLHI